jgi:hypothetical protein
MDTSVFITDNQVIIEDTDSDTSSTSTVEELNILSNGKKVEINIKSELVEKFVKPINSHGFYDKAKSQEIEDGFELSLLRLVHLWFSSDGVINFTNLTKHMDSNKMESKELEEFFIDNPGVMSDSDFYSTDAGIAIRKAWYEFLSGRDFMKYVHETHQLIPSNENFLIFVKQFFPLINFYVNPNSNEQEKLNVIYDAFSFGENKFHVIYSTYSQTDSQIVHKGFVHNIFVNNSELFVLESAQIRKLIDLDKIYWSKTELRYC